MPAERISMRQLREILRLLSAEDVPVREIARRTGVAPSTVRATVKRLHEAGLNWPLPEGFSDAELGALLYTNAGKKPGHRRCPEPDWAAMHRELNQALQAHHRVGHRCFLVQVGSRNPTHNRRIIDDRPRSRPPLRRH